MPALLTISRGSLLNALSYINTFALLGGYMHQAYLVQLASVCHQYSIGITTGSMQSQPCIQKMPGQGGVWQLGPEECMPTFTMCIWTAECEGISAGSAGVTCTMEYTWLCL